MAFTSTQLAATIDAVRAVMPLRAPADIEMSRFFREHPKLGAQDRAFVAEAVFGILRNKIQLDRLSGAQPTPRKLTLAWLAAVYGLNLRELTPYITESEQRWISEVKAAKSASAEIEELAELPSWIVGMLREDGLGDEQIIEMGRAFASSGSLDLRVNTIKANREAVLERFSQDGIVHSPTPFSPHGIRLAGKPTINRHPLFQEGVIEVQDEGSQLLGLLLAPKRGEMIVDFCAGAGGKTLLLGMLMQSSGRLYAFDVSEKRLANLKPRLARSGLSNVHPQLISSENDPKIKRLSGKIDRVLVDAPCSGLGTLRRNPDLKFRQSPQSVAELNAKQLSILASAARLPKVGGRLVYATCSILQVENQKVIESFLQSHPNFVVRDAGEALASSRVELNTGPFLQLNPKDHQCDGFFAAVLERVE